MKTKSIAVGLLFATLTTLSYSQSKSCVAETLMPGANNGQMFARLRFVNNCGKCAVVRATAGQPGCAQQQVQELRLGTGTDKTGNVKMDFPAPCTAVSDYSVRACPGGEDSGPVAGNGQGGGSGSSQPSPPADDATFVKLSPSLLKEGSVSKVHPADACPKWDPAAEWCVQGITFNRPYWQTTTLIFGMSGPELTYGFGMHPLSNQIAHASFNIPPGAKLFESVAGFALHTNPPGCADRSLGDATVVISVDGVKVKQFDLKGQYGHPKDLKTDPVLVSGHSVLNFEVDPNGPNYCDGVFFAGARFTF